MSDLEPSIPAALRQAAQRHPDREALVDGAIRLEFRAFDTAMLDTARALIGLGVQPGDRVAIWAQNCWQWCVAALGSLAVGAVTVPINTRFKGTEAAQLLDSSTPKVFFTTTGFLGNDYPGMLRNAASRHSEVITVVMDGAPEERDISWGDFLGRASTVPVSEAEARLKALRSTDISDVMYTSGTTGVPKGVIQTHAKNLLAMKALASAFELTQDDRNLVLAPMFAQFGLRSGLFMNIIAGATTVVDAVFDGARLLEVIERERITVLPGPPTMLSALLSEDAAGCDLSSLRLGVTGSTVVPEALISELLQRKVFDGVLTAYGLTEACGPVSVTSLTDSPATVASTAGRVLEHVEVKVVDPSGRTVGLTERGELLVRGPSVMNGYLNEPEQTAAAVDAEGWLHTGDIGLIDGDGYVRITGRLKDMVIVGGFNVYLAEVEAAIREHDAVADVSIVGVDDERLGEVCLAFIVAAHVDHFEPQDLSRWCRENLANYKVPRHFVQLDQLPMTSSLKVDKVTLREVAANHVRTPTAELGA